MENENITEIGMEFVDEGEEQQDNQNLPTETPKNEVEEKQPGKVRRFFGAITKPFRWAGRKMKESPAGTAIGMVLGAGVALGTKAVISHFSKKGSEDGFIPADTPEIEVPDYGEVDADPVPTYENENE